MNRLFAQINYKQKIMGPERINGYLPNYLNEHLILNNKQHSRNTRYSSINAVCPKSRLNIEEKQREDALSLFRQQDCGIVHQLKLGNQILQHVLKRTCLPRFLRNNNVCIILSFNNFFLYVYKNRISFYFKCLYILAYNIYQTVSSCVF